MNQDISHALNSISAESTTAILKARARELAQPHFSPAAGNTVHVVEFRLASERYGIEQQYMREVHPLIDLAPLPCVPAFVRGIINLRGQILPVIDIKKFFDLPDEGITDIHVVLVVQCGDVELGILADAIVGMRSMAPEAIQPPLPTLTGVRERYLKGVTEERMAIIDMPAMLHDPKLVVNEEVTG